MAMAGVGAGQRHAQSPQPVQVSATIVGLPMSTAIAPGTGHCSRHVEQGTPRYARHMMA